MGLLEIVQRFDRLVVRRINRIKSMFCAFQKNENDAYGDSNFSDNGFDDGLPESFE